MKKQDINKLVDEFIKSNDKSTTFEIYNKNINLQKNQHTIELSIGNMLIIGEKIDDLVDAIYKYVNKVVEYNNVTHYIKYELTSNLSIRFHFTFVDNKELEMKWCLKVHNSKKYVILNSSIAKQIINELCKDKYEIIGRTINGDYSKIINKL